MTNMGKRIRDTDIEVGKRLKNLRKASGLSQGDIAENLGVTFQQVQKYENGSNRVSLGTFILICKALGASPMDIIGDYFGDDFEPSSGRLAEKFTAMKARLDQVRSIVASA